MRQVWPAAIAVMLSVSPVAAQGPALTGYVSSLFDAVGRTAPEETDLEWRPRIFVEHRHDGDHFRLRLSGYLDGLVGDRHQPDSPTTDLIVRPQELYAEVGGERMDVRLGYSRLVWGRLDELQPTDVVNPLDLARFFFEGRAEARLAVPMARARLFLPESTTLEVVLAPQFRPGRFDQLDEPSSPFNLAPCQSPCRDRDDGPAVTWANVQGGARLQTTSGRVDWSVSAYRGFRPFGVYEQTTPGTVDEVFPRSTMLGGDFETVHGEWGIRAEIAAFVDDAFQAPLSPRAVDGRSVDGGIGADRKAGDFRVSGNLLVRRRFIDQADSVGFDATDVNLIASLDRSFSRETRRLQVFGVYDPTEATSFLRGIFTVSLTDRVSIEASGGVFSGSGTDPLGRFADRDFVYLKVKRHF